MSTILTNADQQLLIIENLLKATKSVVDTSNVMMDTLLSNEGHNNNNNNNKDRAHYLRRNRKRMLLTNNNQMNDLSLSSPSSLSSTHSSRSLSRLSSIDPSEILVVIASDNHGKHAIYNTYIICNS